MKKTDATNSHYATDVMCWSKLLSTQRFTIDIPSAPRNNNSKPSNKVSNFSTVFEDDIERIIYSSAFRRLQGKTQVHPFPRTDYIRNRLTHSVETSHIGRILATSIGRWIIKNQYLHLVGKEPLDESESKHLYDSFSPEDFGDIVAAACLAHDIGNPPFGHIGEHAIQSWFQSRKRESDHIVERLSQNEYHLNDFLHYDGNAQGFRVLLRLQNWRNEGGMRLSHSVLGAMTKYPFCSSYAANTLKKSKFGFFQSERLEAENVFRSLGMIERSVPGKYCLFSRHPLAFIVEAADDICYRTTDIEDAVKARFIDFETGEKLLLDCSDVRYRTQYDQINKDYKQDRIQYLRSSAISSLIEAATLTFIQKYESIMRGNIEQSLLEGSKYAAQMRSIKKACEDLLYVEEKKLRIESGGFNIIHGLLDEFGNAFSEKIVSPEHFSKNQKHKAILNLFPKEMNSETKDVYEACLSLVDFISGMTDRWAKDLYGDTSGLQISV